MDPRATRPWTVYVLVALSIGGVALGLVLDTERAPGDLLPVALGLAFAWFFWAGKSWAFTIAFMLSSLCAGGLVVAALAQLFLFEGAINMPLVLGAINAGVWVALLIHPATKRFAGFNDSSENVTTPVPG